MTETANQGDQQPHAPRRQVARDLVDVETVMIRNGSTQINVRLIDLSPKGFHARCGDSRFERGEVVSLRLPIVGLVSGRVMWSLKGCFGCQLSVPIDARSYRDLLATIRAETPADPVLAAR